MIYYVAISVRRHSLSTQDATAISAETTALGGKLHLSWNKGFLQRDFSKGQSWNPQHRVKEGIMSKAAEKSSVEGAPQTAGSRPTRGEIELRAHQIYVERGGAPGQDVEDWLQAERELLEKHGKAGLKATAAGA